MSDQKREEIERILDRWKPDREDFVPILEPVFESHTQLTGHWSVANGHDGATLDIDQSQDGYCVCFSTFGCLSEWSLNRIGRMDRGVLVLNRPVMEYCPSIYDRLYPVATSDNYYLISQADIRYAMEEPQQEGKIDWEYIIKWRAF